MARRAHSLQTLLDDINLAYPNRDKASDGWIADSNHPSTSDHTPRDGVVHAIDVDEDNKVGDEVVGHALYEWVLDNRPDWLLYMIYKPGPQSYIVSSYPTSTAPAWTPRPYSGSNPHDKHVHLSAKDDRFYSGPHFTRQENIVASDPTWLQENGWPEWSWPYAKIVATKGTDPNELVKDMTFLRFFAIVMRVADYIVKRLKD